MIFVDAENKLKYDTDKMEMISCKCKIRIRFGIVLKPKYTKAKRELVRRGKVDGWSRDLKQFFRESIQQSTLTRYKERGLKSWKKRGDRTMSIFDVAMTVDNEKK